MKYLDPAGIAVLLGSFQKSEGPNIDLKWQGSQTLIKRTPTKRNPHPQFIETAM